MNEELIQFFSEDISFQLSNPGQVSEWIEKITRSENHLIGFLNFIFCSDDYLHNINVEHLNHDTFTDIITFDYSDENTISGDIFISIDRVKENAVSHKSSFDNELHRVIIHGVLHLLGYKDKQPEDKVEMRQTEDFCLSLRDF